MICFFSSLRWTSMTIFIYLNIFLDDKLFKNFTAIVKRIHLYTSSHSNIHEVPIIQLPIYTPIVSPPELQGEAVDWAVSQSNLCHKLVDIVKSLYTTLLFMWNHPTLQKWTSHVFHVKHFEVLLNTISIEENRPDRSNATSAISNVRPCYFYSSNKFLLSNVLETFL